MTPTARCSGSRAPESILGYQGDITDPVTSQVDMGTRWYSAGTGRFTSRDSVFGTMGDPMSLNQYAYGAMNPVTMTDPTGMRPYCDDCSNGTNKHLAHDYSSNQDAYGPGSAYWYSFQPAPPPPAPIIEYSPRPFTSPEQRNGDIDRYHEWVDHNPSVRVDKTGPGWDTTALVMQTLASAIRGFGFGGAVCGLACAWSVVRDWSNDFQAFSYRTIANATGATCVRNAGYWMCQGGDDWVTGFGFATTVGDTIVVDKALGPDTLNHELAHIEQAKALGPFYLPLWFAGWALSAGYGYPEGDCNPLEMGADVSAGTHEYHCGL